MNISATASGNTISLTYDLPSEENPSRFRNITHIIRTNSKSMRDPSNLDYPNPFRSILAAQHNSNLSQPTQYFSSFINNNDNNNEETKPQRCFINPGPAFYSQQGQDSFDEDERETKHSFFLGLEKMKREFPNSGNSCSPNIKDYDGKDRLVLSILN